MIYINAVNILLFWNSIVHANSSHNIAKASSNYRMNVFQTIHKIALLLKTEDYNPKDHLLIIDKGLHNLKKFLGNYEGHQVKLQVVINQVV